MYSKPLSACRVFLAPLISNLENTHKYLSVEECEKLKKITSESRQREFVSGRLLLRHLLAQHLDCAAHELKLELAASGKPFCSHPKSPYFSISHSNNYVAVALCSEEVGVDIERVKPERNFDLIAQNYYSDSENKQLKLIKDNKSKLDYFYQLWVLKEAIVKASGQGLACSLTQIDLSVDGGLVNKLHAFDLNMHLFSKKWQADLWLGLAHAGSEVLKPELITLDSIDSLI